MVGVVGVAVCCVGMVGADDVVVGDGATYDIVAFVGVVIVGIGVAYTVFGVVGVDDVVVADVDVAVVGCCVWLRCC